MPLSYDICPVCGSDDISVNKRRGTVSCGACDYDGAPSADERAGLRELPELPSIVALPLHEYMQETNPVLKLWAACDFVELMLRFLVMAGVADLRRKGDLPETLLREFRDRIERPTLGQWRGMAAAVAKALDPALSVFPELPAYVLETIEPFLAGYVSPATEESSFAQLRNRLAHGGGINRKQAARLLLAWDAPFRAVASKAAWLAETRLLVRDAAANLMMLLGPQLRPAPPSRVAPGALDAAGSAAGAVFLTRGENALGIWPLALYGAPALPGGEPLGQSEAPQVYVRAGELRLQYTPLGIDWGGLSEADDATTREFRALFQLDRARDQPRGKAYAVRGFEADIRKDAQDLVGRAREVALLEGLARETRRGAVWLHGDAGAGKSFVMAGMAATLLESPPPDALVLPYRFKGGDSRCGRDMFQLFAIERLVGWDGLAPESEESKGKDTEKTRPLDALKALLDRMAPERRVIFVLDGLDEIAGQDQGFARDVLARLQADRVLWLCAGRPELGLPETLQRLGALFPFPEGLPRMTEDEVRGMLLEKIGPLRKRLLALDNEQGDEKLVNVFIARVTANAAGLPIYVRYVIGDALSDKLILATYTDLPPSLADYHERMLESYELGDLRRVLPYLVGTLAVAREELSAEALADLLARRSIILNGDKGLMLVRIALSTVAATLRRTLTPEGQEGFTLFHESFRTHILTSPRIAQAVATTRAELARQALTPAPPPDAPAASFLYRRGVAHLLEAGRVADALGLLTDFPYLMARLTALPEPGGVAGLAEDWRQTLDAAPELTRAQRIWEAFFREREHILRRGDEDWPSYKILLQLAMEHADVSPVTQAAERWLEDEGCDWLRNMRRPEKAVGGHCLRVLEGYTEPVRGALLLEDGYILSWADGFRFWSPSGELSSEVKDQEFSLCLWLTQAEPWELLHGHIGKLR